MIYVFSCIVAALLTHLLSQYYEPTAAQALSWVLTINVTLGLYLTRKQPEYSIGLILVYFNTIYVMTLFCSIFTYRVGFHKLRHFPGPFWAGVTKFWTCRLHYDGEYHRETARLHRTYGDVMRVAPNELDINDVEAIKLIYGTSSMCIKGPWYDGPASSGEADSVQSTRDPAVHRWRRKIWTPAFSAAAITDFEPYVNQQLELFLSQIKTHHELDIAEWCNFLTFDIMGDLTFGESFDMLKTGKQHHFMTTLHRFTKVLSILGAIPWLTSLAEMLPAGGDIKEVENFSKQCFDRRRANGSSRKDIFYYLLGEDKETGSRLNEDELVIESRTAIVGGSDTTAITLGCLFYYLTLHQDKYARLRREIDQCPAPLENSTLTKLPYLNAVIYESLRLMPPVPGALQRVTPPGGLHLPSGQRIPEGTFVGVSAWTVQRDPRNWGQPDSFIPERWIDEGPEPCNKNAWIPFSYGTYGCVGKQLALMELRYIVESVVRSFDMNFAPGFDIQGFEATMKNEFNMTSPRVRVKLMPRSGK